MCGQEGKKKRERGGELRKRVGEGNGRASEAGSYRFPGFPSPLSPWALTRLAAASKENGLAGRESVVHSTVDTRPRNGRAASPAQLQLQPASFLRRCGQWRRSGTSQTPGSKQDGQGDVNPSPTQPSFLGGRNLEPGESVAQPVRFRPERAEHWPQDWGTFN